MNPQRFLFCLLLGLLAAPVAAQVPFDSEVRQIVRFSFLPGRSGEALELYVDRAVPLYKKDVAMASFRGFREVESPIPLDLMVVSSFRGMAGMDESNRSLRSLASESGTGIGALYGAISALSTQHTDEFVEMLPELGTGDASSRRLTAFVWTRVAPGAGTLFEDALATTVVPWETENGFVSATGRFLLSDGWHYLRMVAFDSLAEYQSYRTGLSALDALEPLAVKQREVIVASVSDLTVR